MKTVRGYLLISLLCLAFVFGWYWVVNKIWPPAPPKPTQEAVEVVMGGMAVGAEPIAKLKRVGKVEQPPPPEEAKKEPEPDAKKQADIKAAEDVPANGELIPLGHGERPYYLQVLLNTRGGSVQQVILTDFAEANSEGLEVKKNGKPESLRLVPGVKIRRAASIREQSQLEAQMPELGPGPYTAETAIKLTQPSFLMFHYDKFSDERPLFDLGNREWTFAKDESSIDPNSDEQTVVFRTELAEPQNLRITKTFTLKRKEYHVGLKVDIKRLDGKKVPDKFRYQLTGANGLPIEGVWYTSTYRQAIVGFSDERGSTARFISDNREIRNTEGSDPQTRTDKLAIRYAAVAVQYFASAIAVDDQQENRRFLEYVRATPIGPTNKQKEFLDDLTVRAVTEAFSPEKEVTHRYMLYHGPVKVRLLRELANGKEVDGALVDRYLDKLHLNTLTDAPMPNALGRFASAIYWTDLVITFTNLIHSLLWALNQVVPNLGICILIVTLMVRGMLFPLSRRQAHNATVMQQKMAKLQPELKKLQEKYGEDFQRMNQERMALYKEHGVNPFAAMGGCVLLLLQMPVFMGLYYALQESVFFRLEGFLWIQNLAAPDMLVYWSEQIPFISVPADLGSTLYLGPYFNALPFIAVGLMLFQQIKMMPISDDPQVQAQQRMMKFMMVLMGFFFYKVAAGLCLYFIASTLWGLLERKLAPKPVKPEELEDPPHGGSTATYGGIKEDEEDKPLGWWGRKKLGWKEKWKDVLDQAQKQQEYRRDQSQEPPNRPGGKKKKRKK